ncbi:MAG: hypothetical protein FJ335_02465 [Sphingomonadales bacterium]|nr:hypothetical protein [Sphingomonadales bacterium]
MRLDQRVAATERAVARFRGKPFCWRNRRTCIHVARAQARALKHRPPAIPDFRSPVGARRALRDAGFETMEALLDGLFPRIPPAAMWVGDLALVPGSDGFDAIAVAAGNGTLLMYHEGAEGLANVKDAIPHVIAAWRL